MLGVLYGSIVSCCCKFTLLTHVCFDSLRDRNIDVEIQQLLKLYIKQKSQNRIKLFEIKGILKFCSLKWFSLTQEL